MSKHLAETDPMGPDEKVHRRLNNPPAVIAPSMGVAARLPSELLYDSPTSSSKNPRGNVMPTLDFLTCMAPRARLPP